MSILKRFYNSLRVDDTLAIFRHNRTSIRAVRFLTCAACCIREDSSRAHRRAGTIFSACRDTRPCSGTEAARRSCLRPRRSPCLFRSRSRQRNNRAPSPWAAPAVSTDRSRAALRLPIRRRRACRRSRSSKRQHVAVASVSSHGTRVGPGRAGLFVDVLDVARRRAFDFVADSRGIRGRR